jgi:hypothetical protein
LMPILLRIRFPRLISGRDMPTFRHLMPKDN